MALVALVVFGMMDQSMAGPILGDTIPAITSAVGGVPLAGGVLQTVGSIIPA